MIVFSKENSIRNSIAATVIGGLLLSLILWLNGLLQPFWNWAWSNLVKMTYWLLSEVSTPVWSLLILAILFGFLLLKIRKYKRLGILPNPGHNHHNGIENKELSKLETEVLQVLARADGKRVLIKVIVNEVSSSQIRVQQALDDLRERDLLNVALNYVYGPTYSLNRQGRALVIQMGFA